MGRGGLYDNVSRGLSSAKNLLGRAYHGGVKFAQGLDQYAGVARNVIGAVAPMVGSMGGPMVQALDAAVGGGMKALGAYDRLKMDTMNQANQMANVASAARRGLGKWPSGLSPGSWVHKPFCLR